jgi:hypothetical protein
MAAKTLVRSPWKSNFFGRLRNFRCPQPAPARFILLHERPALPYYDPAGSTWTAWHFSRGLSSFHSAIDVRQEVVSPILFVDGHAAKHDFTKAVKSDWPAEPTANWVWYKPAR